MKIAVVSDTHSRHATVGRVVAELQARNVATVIHCGDIEKTRRKRSYSFAACRLTSFFGNCARR